MSAQRAIQVSILFWLVLFLVFNATASPPPREEFPTRLTAQFCAQRVYMEAASIAAARWAEEPKTEAQLQEHVDKAIEMWKPREFPGWFIEMVRAWIHSAYEFSGTYEEWGAKLLDDCNKIPEGEDS